MDKTIKKQVILKAKNTSKSQYGLNIKEKEKEIKKMDGRKENDTNRRIQK